MSYPRSFSQVFGRFGVVAVLAGSSLLASCGGGTDSQASEPNKFGLASAPVPIEASVISVTKVGETRVSRTIFEYTFSITVKNGPKAVSALTATLVGAGVGTTILDGVVDVGPLPAAATTTPTKTIKIRHDRTFAFNASAFQWVFIGIPVMPMIQGRLGNLCKT
jgi:hypothetical protein